MTTGFDAETARMIAANAANWDARTPVHAASRFYGLDGSVPAESWFAPYEWADLGDLTGRDLLHLQCHLGTETIALARRGARTTGLDISAAAITEARRIARDAELHVDYVHADVHDAPQALPGRTFDVIYTGKGSLVYLPDLARWADVIRRLLRPGGLLYLVEFHPMLNALGPNPGPGEGDELLLRHDYLSGRGPIERDSTATYTDGPPVRGATTSYEWLHGLGDVVTALVGAGLRITTLREDEDLPWPRWPSMTRTDQGWWRLPHAAPRIPLLFALAAHAPA